MDLAYTFSGFAVGLLIGLTGVGGGSLMTPILIFGFKIPPIIAVGTDLLFAAITKASGTLSHSRLGNIDWKIVGLLALGSIPTTSLTLYLMNKSTSAGMEVDTLIHVSLGIALILTSMVLIFKHKVYVFGNKIKSLIPHWRRLRSPATVLAGIMLGILVPVSSIGAGAIGAAILLFMYPSLPTSRIVGTDLAHAVPLTAVAGLGHLQMGSVDLMLLGALLLGSLPGIYLGSHISTVIPEKIMRPILASMLMLIGMKFIIVS
ncbi:MAG: sulfite exporter TauE/SafE family protein [Gammaproteobacteria bacterium]